MIRTHMDYICNILEDRSWKEALPSLCNMVAHGSWRTSPDMARGSRQPESEREHHPEMARLMLNLSSGRSDLSNKFQLRVRRMNKSILFKEYLPFDRSVFPSFFHITVFFCMSIVKLNHSYKTNYMRSKIAFNCDIAQESTQLKSQHTQLKV